MPERFHFDVGGSTTTATAYAAKKPIGATLLFGSGSSAGQSTRFIVDYATGLAERGVLVVTYDFLYAADGRREPDPNETLEACCRAAIAVARRRRPRNRLFVGGKSLGARIAAQVLAAGGPEVADVAGLVALGTMLHPVGKRSMTRARALREVRVPILLVQGTRDVFGTAEELRRALGELPPGSAILPVEGGDHSFVVSKRATLAQGQVHAATQDEIARWIAATAPARASGGAVAIPRAIASRVRQQLRTLRQRHAH